MHSVLVCILSPRKTRPVKDRAVIYTICGKKRFDHTMLVHAIVYGALCSRACIAFASESPTICSVSGFH